MRAPAAILAVAATLALAGCSGSEPHSPVDPEHAESTDYLVPTLIVAAITLAALAIAVAVRIARRRRRQAPSSSVAPPPDKKGP